jgi:hypothetical protein
MCSYAFLFCSQEPAVSELRSRVTFLIGLVRKTLAKSLYKSKSQMVTVKSCCKFFM